MAEYDELVKMLRTCAERDSCIGWREACSYLGTGVCDNKAEKAADAIEFLQTYKTCFDDIVSMGGWWLVGQDKNLYRMNVPMNWPPKGTKVIEPFPLPEPPKKET